MSNIDAAQSDDLTSVLNYDQGVAWSAQPTFAKTNKKGANMPKPTFTPTNEARSKVKSLIAVGIPQDDVAKIIGCSPKTLRKHFRQELKTASAEATAAVGGFLFQAAKSGNVTAMIFWLKTRGRWKAPESTSDSEDTGATPSPGVVVVLPDNGRGLPDDYDFSHYLDWQAKGRQKAARRKARLEAKIVRRRGSNRGKI
jgi:hypothetical protein